MNRNHADKRFIANKNEANWVTLRLRRDVAEHLNNVTQSRRKLVAWE